MKISRYFRDGLLANDRLERHRAFPGRRNAVCRDLLESHFYREPGCRNDNSFILTKNLPTPTDDCSLQMNHPGFPPMGANVLGVQRAADHGFEGVIGVVPIAQAADNTSTIFR